MANNKSFEELDIFKDDKKRRKYLIAVIGVIAAILLVVICLLASRSVQDNEFSSAATSEEETTTEAESLVVADTSIPFTLCEDEDIISLVQSYFDARLNADSSQIYALFGRSDTSLDANFEQRLQVQNGWIQGFNDITVYTVPGTTDDELLCLVTYTIDFRRTDAMAPGVMYFYAERAGDGNYTILETLPKEKVDYANAFLEADSASTIIDSIDTKLQETLATDSTLALIYTSFVNGDIYSEADLETEREPEVDIVFNAEDSVLVGESDIANMEAEALDAASKEAAESAADIASAEALAQSASSVDAEALSTGSAEGVGAEDISDGETDTEAVSESSAETSKEDTLAEDEQQDVIIDPEVAIQ